MWGDHFGHNEGQKRLSGLNYIGLLKRRFNGNLVEAMSVGMAVAACREGVDDMLVEGETAVIFDADDELSIYAALQRLLDKRELARRIAMNGQLQIRRNHSVSKMVSAFINTYRKAGQWYKKKRAGSVSDR